MLILSAQPHTHTPHSPPYNYRPDQESEHIKPPRSLPSAKLDHVYFSLSSWFSLRHNAKAFMRSLFTVAFYFSFYRGRETDVTPPVYSPKFTTWLWQGRTLSCWASPVPGAGAGWWKAGVQSRKSDLPTQIFLPDVGVCCSNCAYPVPPMLPLGAHTGLPLGSRRTLSVPGPIRAEPEVGVGWWYQAFCRWTQAAPAPRGLV